MTSHERNHAAPGPRPARHPQALTVLTLGMLAIVGCGLTGPFAWSLGNRVLGEIEESGRAIGGHEMVSAGRLCGMLGTGFLALGGLFLVTAVLATLISGL